MKSLYIYTQYTFKLQFTAMPWFKQKNIALFHKPSCITTIFFSTANCAARSFQEYLIVIYHLNCFSAIVVIAICRCYRCESCDAPLKKTAPVSHLSSSMAVNINTCLREDNKSASVFVASIIVTGTRTD